MRNIIKSDVVILGAGAAGMMCAIEAGRKGRSVTIIDHAKSAGDKIRISGGGRCNFTNINSAKKHFLSQNPYFAISALKSYTPQNFIDKVSAHGIAFHEKALGQLFCDNSATQIVKMLLDEMQDVGVRQQLKTDILKVVREDEGFLVSTSYCEFYAPNLVVALGGKSIPKMGATGLGYEIAEQFGHKVTPTRPALVPFTWPAHMVEKWGQLSGVSQDVRATCGKGVFSEPMLMTHRGLSGPAILQVSSYWREGDTIEIDLLPDSDIEALLKQQRQDSPNIAPVTMLTKFFTKRLAQRLIEDRAIEAKRIGEMNNSALEALSLYLKKFKFIPGGSEGYRTAEVTLGGVDTKDLDQKTMASKKISGLHFIGEVVDVTGHLGGHNFQWAWSSAVAAGRSL